MSETTPEKPAEQEPATEGADPESTEAEGYGAYEAQNFGKPGSAKSGG